MKIKVEIRQRRTGWRQIGNPRKTWEPSTLAAEVPLPQTITVEDVGSFPRGGEIVSEYFRCAVCGSELRWCVACAERDHFSLFCGDCGHACGDRDHYWEKVKRMRRLRRGIEE